MFIIGVVNVADCKQQVNKHVSSAQQWLSQAEQAFAKDREIRGELNLFLAQAELTHAQEVNRSGKKRYQYPVLRHSLACGLAVVIAVCGLGASFWWGEHYQRNQNTARVQQVATTPAMTSPVQAPSVTQPAAAVAAALPPATAVSPAVPAAAELPPAGNKPAAQPVNEQAESMASPKSAADAGQSKEIPLTTDEINKLVRTAGQSLRGQ